MAAYAAVRHAIGQLRVGGLVVLYDDQKDQGDLMAAAAEVTQETVAAMVHRAGGLVSAVLTPEQARHLGLQRLPVRREGGRRMCERTPSMVSVDARASVSTGISAADRARTISVLASQGSTPWDLVSSGHVFPFVAADGGVLERAGRLEAAVDAVRLAGLAPAAALCDVLDDEGGLAGLEVLRGLASTMRIPFVSISQLVEARFDELWSSHPHSSAGPDEPVVHKPSLAAV